MITAKQAYEIAKEWMGPFALVSSGYETDTHFIFLRSITGGNSGRITLPSGLTRRTAN